MPPETYTVSVYVKEGETGIFEAIRREINDQLGTSIVVSPLDLESDSLQKTPNIVVVQEDPYQKIGDESLLQDLLLVCADPKNPIPVITYALLGEDVPESYDGESDTIVLSEGQGMQKLIAKIREIIG